MQPKLLQLTVSGFRSFDSASTVTFPESGLVLLQGQNNDTGGSSGSGKSSLLLALSYLLGFCKYPSTTLQSWGGEPMQVMGSFAVTEGTLLITRGKKFSVSLNGAPIEGSAKDLEAAIVQYVGLTPDLIAALSYRGQKTSGLFLSKGDTAKKEFLTTVLGLERFERAVEDSRERAKKLEQEVGNQAAVVAALEAQVVPVVEPTYHQSEDNTPSLEAAVAFAKATVAKARDGSFRALAAMHDGEANIQAKYGPLLSQYDEAIAEASAPIAEVAVDTSDLTAQLNRAKQFLTQLRTAEQQTKAQYMQETTKLSLHEKTVQANINAIRSDLAKAERLRAEIAQIEAGRCGTCLQDWVNEGSRLHLDGLQAELKELRTVRDLEQAELELDNTRKIQRELAENPPAADENILKLEGIVADLTAELATKEQEARGRRQLLLAEQAQAIQTARSKKLETEVVINNEMAGLREAYRTAQSAVQEAEYALKQAEVELKIEKDRLSTLIQVNSLLAENYEKALAQSVKTSKAVQAAKAKLNETQAKLNAEKDFAAAIGREGFLGAIFDEVLDEISTEVNALLGKFPNTAHVSLKFVSEAETKKGGMKKAITPIVNIGGNEAPLSSGLSGGMETAVELAVDLAVAEVVSRRSGVMPGWLILDEAFTGLGPVEAEACMEILAEYAQERLVLVVDHASETKEHFSNVITVDYTNGSSKVVDS